MSTPLFSAERERDLRREHERLHPDGLKRTGRVCETCLLLEQLKRERGTFKSALHGCIPWVSHSGRGAAQEALAVACDLVGSDPFDWSQHPEVLVSRVALLDRRTRERIERRHTSTLATLSPPDSKPSERSKGQS